MVDFKEIKKSMTIFILVLVGMIIGILVVTNIYTVQTGEVAIISEFGKVVRVEQAGLHFKIPFIESKDFLETREKTYYFIKQDNEDSSLMVSTKDLQTINIEITVQAIINNPELLYKSFKKNYENRFIKPRVMEITQATISKYTIEEFVSKRQEISNVIYTKLKDDFNKYGILVSNISIINHDFSDEYEKAIELKKVAEQAVETEKAKQEKLVIEAENRVKLAELNLKQKELQAKANAVESSTLTKELLEKMKIEKWDGKLPQVMGDKGVIIDFNK